MKKHFSLKKIYLIVVFSIVVIFIVAFTVLKMSFESNLILFIFFSFSILLTSCFTFLIIAIHRRLTLFSKCINSTIDLMITDKKFSCDLPDDETLFSQILHNLNRLYKSLNDTRAISNQEKTELQELISDISHQIKTPLAILKATNSTMKSALIQPQDLEQFVRINEIHLEKLDFLLSSLITTSRLETGIICLIPEKNNISDTILTALENTVISASKKDIEIQFDYSDDISAVFDPKWTTEALSNILDNAIKYTDSNGTVSISLTKLDIYTKISISDTGIGILESEIPKIFKRFYRSPSVNQKPGVGIGLYLANYIIQQQHGFIHVNSKIGVGSTFNIFLPSSC